jgi:hypothetical protein
MSAQPMPKHLSTFSEMVFPSQRNIVYVLCCSGHNESPLVPFYVGQSSRHVGRFGDYISANFSASTDFKVGEAVRYLLSVGLQVTIKYQETENRKTDERILIETLKGDGYVLLNDLRNYDYLTADECIERERIHCYVQQIVTLNSNVKAL